MFEVDEAGEGLLGGIGAIPRAAAWGRGGISRGWVCHGGDLEVVMMWKEGRKRLFVRRI